MTYAWFFYKPFGISIFDFTDASDFLLVAFYNPTMLLAAVGTVLFLALILVLFAYRSLKRGRPFRVGWVSRILLVVVLVVYTILVPYYLGKKNSQAALQAESQPVRVTIRQDAVTPKTRLPARASLIGTTSGFHFLYEKEKEQLFIVPTPNLASLEFNPPPLAEPPEEAEISPPPAELAYPIPESQCQLEKFATIAPFPESDHILPAAIVEEQFTPMLNRMQLLFNTHNLKQLMLIGRTDTQQLQEEQRTIYGSDSGLAQARATWVQSQLLTKFPDQVDPTRIIVLSSGPQYIGPDVSAAERQLDRSVEIHACWVTAAQPETSPLVTAP